MQRDTISVIIPARNEALNLPKLLESLAIQSVQPDEVIVVDDGSEDDTRAIGQGYGVKVLIAPDLPDGWTGKTWAVWNGYLQSSGEILVFLDADVRLSRYAMESLIAEQKKQGGVISAVPYHKAEKFYEKFAMMLNVLGVFAFTSPFERRNSKKGLYGACIITSRYDYEKIGGHEGIRSEMLDDLNLGARFQREGIKVSNYLGGRLVAFRMYGHGVKSELEGFSKGAILSTSAVSGLTLVPLILWIVGLIASQTFFFYIGSHLWFALCVGYALYAVEFLYFSRHVGSFGVLHPICHFMSLVFFLVVVGYSLYQAVIRKKVVWKGRYVDVGGDNK